MVISFDSLTFSLFTQLNLSHDNALIPVLVVALMVPGIDGTAAHAWVTGPDVQGALLSESSV